EAGAQPLPAALDAEPARARRGREQPGDAELLAALVPRLVHAVGEEPERVARRELELLVAIARLGRDPDRDPAPLVEEARRAAVHAHRAGVAGAHVAEAQARELEDPGEEGQVLARALQ